MSREIKFRAWGHSTYHEDAASEMMLYDDDDFYVGYHCGAFGSLNDERFIFMQFTGLHDKNGVDIYEGDIVESDHGDGSACAIEFGESANDDGEFLGIGFYWGDGSRLAFGGNDVNDNPVSSFVKVVGNIHENPELLT